MIYRVRADLPFTEEDEAHDFLHDCAKALSKATTINSGQATEERGTISLEECYHDEDPTLPCYVLEEHKTPV